MVKLWALCTNHNLHKTVQCIIISFILFFVIAKPVIEIVLDLVVYELCEIYEDDEMEEKEEQNKEVEFHNSNKPVYVSYSRIPAYIPSQIILFSLINYILEFYLEIPLPPPEHAS